MFGKIFICSSSGMLSGDGDYSDQNVLTVISHKDNNKTTAGFRIWKNQPSHVVNRRLTEYKMIDFKIFQKTRGV